GGEWCIASGPRLLLQKGTGVPGLQRTTARCAAPGTPAQIALPSRRAMRRLRERRPVDRAADVAVAQVGARRAVLLVLLLHQREAVAVRADVCALGDVVVVELGIGAAEDRGLDRAIGGTDRLEALPLLHVLGGLEPAP